MTGEGCGVTRMSFLKVEMSTMQIVLVAVLVVDEFLQCLGVEAKITKSKASEIGDSRAFTLVLLEVFLGSASLMRIKDTTNSFRNPNFDFSEIYAGPIYMFSSGTVQWLVVTNIEILKEVIMYTSLDLGKPTHLAKDLGPLLGHGILTSSGQLWAHQRKIIALELYLNKVKELIRPNNSDSSKDHSSSVEFALLTLLRLKICFV
ncbi:hypothetical protein Fmac_028788 [Flemingia macrophylla]|uniref:Cytochrome P450 n=1 Tax=Flemingia macrophylla TaxID=520843 RepID=A0ABD1L8I0_9FABA